MDNSGQLSKELRDDAYRKILDIMLSSLENGSLSAEESEDASLFVLDRLDSIPSQNHLNAFLEEVANRWPSFKPLLQAQHKKDIKATERKNIESIKSEINKLT